MKNLLLTMNEKIPLNKIYIDLATEFFHSLMVNASFLTSNACKAEIIEFFLESVNNLNNQRNSLTCRNDAFVYGET